MKLGPLGMHDVHEGASDTIYDHLPTCSALFFD